MLEVCYGDGICSIRTSYRQLDNHVRDTCVVHFELLLTGTDDLDA